MSVGSGSEHVGPRSVSVVIATRDRPELLRRAIAGIRSQRHDDDVEIIVVFDRSEPDRSLEQGPGEGPRIVVTSNDRTPGLAGARNSGIDKAANAWIAFCDDDDEWLPGKLQAQFDAVEATPGAVAACTGILIRYRDVDTPRLPSPDRVGFDDFLRDRMTEVHPSSWLVRRETLVDEIGLVDEELPGSYGEDYDLLLRTARLGPIAVAPQPLIRVWWHGGSYFFERWKTIDDALDYLVDKYPEFQRHPDGLARIRGQQAVARAAMGQRRRALATVTEILRLRPTEKRWPLAIAVVAGLPADRALAWAHRLGRGI
ncbi:MAG: glycosyltransferase family 2 protein [Actinomycetota bacterium]